MRSFLDLVAGVNASSFVRVVRVFLDVVPCELPAPRLHPHTRAWRIFLAFRKPCSRALGSMLPGAGIAMCD